jgi:hypothetical protein
MSTENYELLLLAALLASPEYVASTPLEGNAFGDARCRSIYEVMQFLKDGDLNEATICQELQNKGWSNVESVKFVSTLNGLTEYVKPESIEFYCQRINDAYGKRVLSGKVAKVLTQIKDSAVPLGDNIAALGELAIGSQLGTMDFRDPTGAGIVKRLFESAEKGIKPAFASGLPLVDRALTIGGVAPEEMWVLSGQYKGYKSRIAMHMCDTAISQGKSVSYFALEGNEMTFSTSLMAAHFGIGKKWFYAAYRNEKTPRDADLFKAHDWLAHEVGNRWRVYDRKQGIGSNWKRFAPRLMADKMKYGTDLVILDHLQLYSRDYKVLSEVVNMLMDVVSQAEVAMVVISQVSNQDLREGFIPGMFSTKGTGDLAALANVGLEVQKPENADFTASERVMQMLSAQGMDKYVNSQRLLSEVALTLKIVREGNTPQTSCIFEPFSGKMLCQMETPVHISFK